MLTFQNKAHLCLLFFLFWQFAEFLGSLRSDRPSSSADTSIIDQLITDNNRGQGGKTPKQNALNINEFI